MRFFQCIKLLVVALVLWGPLSVVSAQSNNSLTIYVDNAYQPYMYSLDNLQAEGLYPRIIAETLRVAGYASDIKAYPWKRALIFAEAGNGAVGGAYKNDKREQIFDYSDPIFEERLVLFVKKDKQFEFNSIEDLKGKTLGVNRGWSYGQEFDDARARKLFDVIVRNSHADSFKMLALDRIDGVVLDKLAGEAYLSTLGLQNELISLDKPVSVNNGYLIISKQLNMQGFLNEFNKALNKLRKEGKYDEIVQRFLNDTLSE